MAMRRRKAIVARGIPRKIASDAVLPPPTASDAGVSPSVDCDVREIKREEHSITVGEGACESVGEGE
jgi:hypothetical protein